MIRGSNKEETMTMSGNGNGATISRRSSAVDVDMGSRPTKDRLIGKDVDRPAMGHKRRTIHRHGGKAVTKAATTTYRRRRHRPQLPGDHLPLHRCRHGRQLRHESRQRHRLIPPLRHPDHRRPCRGRHSCQWGRCRFGPFLTCRPCRPCHPQCAPCRIRHCTCHRLTTQ